MPVGFENSALKMSFSLSSLQSGGEQGSPQQAMMQVERPYNSLTKKSRGNLEREMWRRSWGTQEEKKDDFWAALQPNYNYLMDNNLIESCKEAHGELSCDEEETALLSKWSFKDFTAQFSELCSWLNDIQETVYGKEENIRNQNLRREHVEAMQRNVYKRKLFTEQAKRLLMEHSELQDEVSWRVNYLSSKWDMLEQSISPSKVNPSQKSFRADVQHEADCLKEWIREMERRLKPLNMHFVSDWNKQELVEKVTEYKVLHQDIRAHGKVVIAVLKRAELAEATASVQLAKRLERRWHLLFLRALEWQFHLENLLKLHKHPLPVQTCSESDEEPLSKHPRLSGSGGDCSDQLTDDGSYFEDDIKEYCVKDTRSSDLSISAENSLLSQTCSVQSKEIGVNVCQETTSHEHEDQNLKRTSKDTVSNKKAEEESTLPHVQTISSATSLENEDIIFKQLNQKLNNYATIYCKHDANLGVQNKGNVEEEHVSSLNRSQEIKLGEDSSDEEWTYTSGKKTVMPKEKGSCNAARTSNVLNRKRNVAIRLDFDNAEGQTSTNEVTGGNVHCQRLEGNLESNVADSFYNDLTLPRSTQDTKECIQWLVRQAEMLVREDNLTCSGEASDPLTMRSDMTSRQSRDVHIKEWVKMHSTLKSYIQVPDSCDASGEYTTGDSDEEFSLESHEEFNSVSLVNKHLDALLSNHPRLDSAESVSNANVTCSAETCEESNDVKGISKVIMRGKQRCKQERPWSVSGISQLVSPPGKVEESGFANFSTSESALHKMLITPNNLMCGEASELSCGFQGNLSSSTVIESTKTPSETHNSSLQRRRVKQRKKSFQASCTKNDTSESTNPVTSYGNASTPNYKNVKCSFKPHLLNSQTDDKNIAHSNEKTRTISETTCTSAVSEHNSISDSSVFPSGSSSSKIVDECDVTLRPEEEVSENSSRFPVFRLGPKDGAVTSKANIVEHAALQSGADSDMERTGCVQAGDEQLSSSEQAWDNYQEKYMSEPYSEEIADSEVARRLLEFGDDYHNFLDSQSDYASSVEFSQRTFSQRKRKSTVGAGDSSVLDSDSDLEDIHHVIEQSQSHYLFTEQVLNNHLSKSSSDVWVSDYAEIIATCRENKRCLRVIFENVKGDILTLKERKEIGELLEKWNTLQIHADELQRVSSVQQKLIIFRKRLLDMTTNVSSLVNSLNNMTHLELAIQALKEEVLSLLNFKDQLLQLKVAVHELDMDNVFQHHTISTAVPQLKDEVTDLYRIWSSSFQSVSSQLIQFERAVQTWEKFDKELSDLQTTLQGDHSTLLSLCKSLDDGATAVEDVAVSIRDIARLLSDVPGTYNKIHHSSSQDLQDASLGTREGSLSDSGISDSGSENELSERARRLASLRQLALHLQTELGSSDGLVSQVNKRIEQLDHELHQLQDVCRTLIVRTKFWTEIPDPEEVSNNGSKASTIIQPSKVNFKMCANDTRESSKSHRWSSVVCTETLENKNDTTGNKRFLWIRRVARAAFPLQLTLMTLLCLACFLEPHCCESVNNLSLSLSPQLRYVYGPPPV